MKKKRTATHYFDLPEKERQRMMLKAGKEAQKEQQNILELSQEHTKRIGVLKKQKTYPQDVLFLASIPMTTGRPKVTKTWTKTFLEAVKGNTMTDKQFADLGYRVAKSFAEERAYVRTGTLPHKTLLERFCDLLWKIRHFIKNLIE